MRGSLFQRWAAGGTTITIGILSCVGAAPGVDAPALLSLTPGITNVVQLRGEDINSVRVWSSLPLVSTPRIEATNDPRWALVAPPETELGLSLLRFETPKSLGAYKVVLIDPLPTAPEPAGGHNGTQEHPILLKPLQAVEGKFEGASAQHFQIDLQAGERIYLEVVAQRLGQNVDPQLRLQDSGGRELAQADDSAISGQDPWLEFTAPRRDSYRVQLSDSRQPPGASRRYRLRATRTHPAPLAWLPSLPPVPQLGELLPRKMIAGSDGESRQTLDAFPMELQGLARPPGARDVFEFDATRDQRLRVDLWDRRIGSVGDFTARIESLDDRVLAETDLSKPELASANWTVPANGRYRLVIEEITGAGGAGYNYRACLRINSPDFLLQITDPFLEIASDETVEVKVKVQRRGYDGLVQLSVNGLPANAEIEGREISAKANEATLKLKLPAGIPVGTRFAMTVTGAVETDGLRYETRADTRTALRKLFPEFNEPPPFLDGWLWLSVVEKKSGK